MIHLIFLEKLFFYLLRENNFELKNLHYVPIDEKTSSKIYKAIYTILLKQYIKP